MRLRLCVCVFIKSHWPHSIVMPSPREREPPLGDATAMARVEEMLDLSTTKMSQGGNFYHTGTTNPPNGN